MSNYDVEQLQKLIKIAHIKPAVNQVCLFLCLLLLFPPFFTLGSIVLTNPPDPISPVQLQNPTRRHRVWSKTRHRHRGLWWVKVRPCRCSYLWSLRFLSFPFLFSHSVPPSLSSDDGLETLTFTTNSPLTKFPNGPVDPVISAIASRLKITSAQVLLAWVRGKGVGVVTCVLFPIALFFRLIVSPS